MLDDDAHDVADGPVVARTRLPDWPRLMPLRLACAYFGVCDKTFRALGIAPRRIGRRVLWDRADLDRWADAMAGMAARVPDRSVSVRATERRFYERMKNGKPQKAG